MKTLKISIATLLFAMIVPLQAQTADEIITNYFENTGGIDNWKNMSGMKMTAKVNQGGMEIPLEIYQMKEMPFGISTKSIKRNLVMLPNNNIIYQM